MRSLIILTVALAALSCVFADEEKYNSPQLEAIDVDELIANDRIVISNCKCILSEGPCTSVGNELKVVIPDALTNNCAKCTDTMKHKLAKVIDAVRTKHDTYFVKILDKFDPKKEKRGDVEKFLAEYLSA